MHKTKLGETWLQIRLWILKLLSFVCLFVCLFVYLHLPWLLRCSSRFWDATATERSSTGWLVWLMPSSPSGRCTWVTIRLSQQTLSGCWQHKWQHKTLRVTTIWRSKDFGLALQLGNEQNSFCNGLSSAKTGWFRHWWYIISSYQPSNAIRNLPTWDETGKRPRKNWWKLVNFRNSTKSLSETSITNRSNHFPP